MSCTCGLGFEDVFPFQLTVEQPPGGRSLQRPNHFAGVVRVILRNLQEIVQGGPARPVVCGIEFWKCGVQRARDAFGGREVHGHNRTQNGRSI
jgi:hypothetical protein